MYRKLVALRSLRVWRHFALPRLSAGPVPAPLVALGAIAFGVPGAAQFELEKLAFTEVSRGFSAVTSIAHAGDGSGRLFITEQVGRVLVHDGRQVLDPPFLDIRDRVQAGGERGLLSVAFHPSHASNGHFFVNYTDRASDTVVSRFEVSANDPNLADARSETVFYRVSQPRRNHNGGQLQFGPHGYLYIGLGDGGGAGDPLNAGQDLSTPLGKLLRVDVDRGPPAQAPQSNPFAAGPRGLPEIWAYGLRNPWRFSFDRKTGDLFIADVGQNALEEISFQPAESPGGENYGWRLMEGSRCFRPASGCEAAALVVPILEYGHEDGNCGGSVTGGYRYRGAMYPEIAGLYFFADYCTGNFYAGRDTGGGWTLLGPRQTAFKVRTFGEDETGELYFADAAVLYRVEVQREPPAISEVGLVTDAPGQAATALAAGALASVVGTGLAPGTQVATEHPLPTLLGGGAVVFNGEIPAPQLLASPGQRNFQVPWELAGLARATLEVQLGTASSAAITVRLAEASPGIFTLGDSGQALALIGTTGFLAGPAGLSPTARPAISGEIVHLLATGLGPVTDRPATGAAAPRDPVSLVVGTVAAEVGGVEARVVHAGLAPEFSALYVVSVEIPAAAPPGNSVPVVVSVGGAFSPEARIAIRAAEGGASASP